MIYLLPGNTLKWEIRKHVDWEGFSGSLYFEDRLTCTNVIRYYGPIDIAVSGVCNAPNLEII